MCLVSFPRSNLTARLAVQSSCGARRARELIPAANTGLGLLRCGMAGSPLLDGISQHVLPVLLIPTTTTSPPERLATLQASLGQSSHTMLELEDDLTVAARHELLRHLASLLRGFRLLRQHLVDRVKLVGRQVVNVCGSDETSGSRVPEDRGLDVSREVSVKPFEPFPEDSLPPSLLGSTAG